MKNHVLSGLASIAAGISLLLGKHPLDSKSRKNSRSGRIGEKSSDYAEPAAEEAVDDFWTRGNLSDLGYFVSGKGICENYHPEALLVFIHGFQGHYQKTWKNLPVWLQQSAGFCCDTFSFWFASQIYHETDYRTAADDLAKLLKESDEYKHYRHIVFIVHSTGGLIAKHLLCLEKEQLEKNDHVSTFDQDFVILRTRRIINVAVPHDGGSLFLRRLFCVAWPLFSASSIFLRSIQFIFSLLDFNPRFPLGKNQIMVDLAFGQAELRNLEREYRSLIEILDRRILPRPVSIDYLGREDRAILMRYTKENKLSPYVQVNKSRAELHAGGIFEIFTLRGSHSSFKLPKVRGELFEILVARAIRDLGQVTLTTLIDRTIEATVCSEYELGITELVGETEKETIPEYKADPRRTVDHSWLGSQKAIFNQIVNKVVKDKRFNAASDFWALTGDAGVGKSTILLRVCRFLAVEATRGKIGQVPVPILIPFAAVEGLDHSQNMLGDLLEWWCEWANGVNADLVIDGNARIKDPVSIDWFRKQCSKNSPIFIAADGLDDYIASVPSMSIYSVFTALRDYSALHKPRHLTFMLGIRSSNEVGGFTTSDKILEIGRISEAQAAEIATKDSFESAFVQLPERVKNVFLSPLVFFNLQERGDLDLLSTRADIMTEALRALIRKSLINEIQPFLPLNNETGSGPFDEGVWLDCLSVLGQIFFTAGRSLSINELVLQISKAQDSWINNKAPLGLGSKQESLVQKLQLLNCPKILHLLLRKTVFSWIGGYRVRHREWLEFLAAKHMLLALRFENAVELSGRGASTRMHFYVGELLNAKSIASDSISSERTTGSFASTVRDQAIALGLNEKNPYAQIPIGNFTGMIGHSNRIVDSQAIGEILSWERFSWPLLSFVPLQTIGHRIIMNDEDNDMSFNNIVAALHPFLIELKKPNRDPILKLTASIFRAAISNDQKEIDEALWPSLLQRESNLVNSALRYVAQEKNGGWYPNEMDASMQRVFMNMLDDVLEYPSKAVPATAYLICIFAADLHNCSVKEIRRGLPSLVNSERGEKLLRIAELTLKKHNAKRAFGIWEYIFSTYRKGI